jgi:hypothetical protein
VEVQPSLLAEELTVESSMHNETPIVYIVIYRLSSFIDQFHVIAGFMSQPWDSLVEMMTTIKIYNNQEYFRVKISERTKSKAYLKNISRQP